MRGGGGYWTGSVGAWMPTGPGPLSVIAAVRYKMDGLHAARGRRRRRLQARARLGLLVGHATRGKDGLFFFCCSYHISFFSYITVLVVDCSLLIAHQY
jgi:hypothetical protein